VQRIHGVTRKIGQRLPASIRDLAENNAAVVSDVVAGGRQDRVPSIKIWRTDQIGYDVGVSIKADTFLRTRSLDSAWRIARVSAL
jgi:hypothetical protein